MKIRKALLLIYRNCFHFFEKYGFKRFYFARIINRFIIFCLRSNSVDIRGHKMFLDSKDSLTLSIFESYEPVITDFIEKEIKKDFVVLDIGANIGYYTLIFAKLVGENGKIFAFEPDPTNFALLKKNMEINNYKNAALIQKAVSDKTGKAMLYLCDNNKGDHRIYDSDDGRRSIPIESIRLDDYFKDYVGKIDFIKIDTQGADELVIKGMPNLLRKNKNLKIILEFWPLGVKKSGGNAKEFLQLLIEYGFKIYDLGNERRAKPADIAELLKIYTCEKNNYTDFLCIK